MSCAEYLALGFQLGVEHVLPSDGKKRVALDPLPLQRLIVALDGRPRGVETGLQRQDRRRLLELVLKGGSLFPRLCQPSLQLNQIGFLAVEFDR